MKGPIQGIPTAILGAIGILSIGTIAKCSSEVGRYYGWFSVGFARVLGVFGLVLLVAGDLAMATLLVVSVVALFARICARYPESVPRGRDAHRRYESISR